jgi:hypothetical protein
MNGQELYEFYVILNKKSFIYPVIWALMSEKQQQIWTDMADLLAPELSDDAKELLK